MGVVLDMILIWLIYRWVMMGLVMGLIMGLTMGLLVGGNWNHGILNDFPIILGISSSQLTKSYFSEG